jgi:hypothetical protein
MRARPSPFPLIIREHAHLLDVGRSVDLIDKDVADWRISLVNSHPDPLRVGVGEECFDRRRLVVGDMIQPEVPKAFARRPLDFPKDGELIWAAEANERSDALSLPPPASDLTARSSPPPFRETFGGVRPPNVSRFVQRIHRTIVSEDSLKSAENATTGGDIRAKLTRCGFWWSRTTTG